MILFQYITLNMQKTLYPVTRNVCSCQNATMYKSVISYLFYFMKQARQRDTHFISSHDHFRSLDMAIAFSYCVHDNF